MSNAMHSIGQGIKFIVDYL